HGGSIFFFQAEDGIRDFHVTWSSDVCSSDLQASWGDLEEAWNARREAYGSHAVRRFHMDTNYRNAQEIFDYARDVILPLVPDAEIGRASCRERVTISVDGVA